ncbi:MAG: polysaccharide lyase [Nannocystaceae bacterium]|nr:polysaccharide lyase [Nannocystaceae bacterium]
MGDAAESSSSSSTSTGVPGYTPFFRMDCNDGELGAEAIGPDALASASRVVYSDDEAVDDQGQSCRTWIDAGANFFGGTYVHPDVRLSEGDDIWMRQGVFFPDGFCFGYGETPGDGWGALKWMRTEFDNGDPGDRLTLQLGNFAAQGCNEQSEIYGATREYAGNANLTPESSPPIQAGRWHMLQWHVHLAADDNAFIRFWLDDTFISQVDGVTLGASDRAVAFIGYGDYWNGSPYEDSSWYTDEVIMTAETPDTFDAQGNPFIDPTARADDWE